MDNIKIVYAFSDKPARINKDKSNNRFANKQDMLDVAELSVRMSRINHRSAELYTDDETFNHLPFTKIHNSNIDTPYGIWSGAKFYALREIDRPTYMIDLDFILRDRVPLKTIVAQFPENFVYRPQNWYQQSLQKMKARGILPKFVDEYMNTGKAVAACCGIMGGSDIDFFREYANFCIDWSKRNKEHIDTTIDTVTVEQLFITALAWKMNKEFHFFQQGNDSRIQDGGFRFVHIHGDKKNPKVLAGVRERLEEIRQIPLQ